MREILFRGVRKKTDKWEFGNLVRFFNGDCAIINGSGSDSFILLHVIPETVGQYTGLKDKNGVKIFEGDVLACGDNNVSTEVRWVQESCAFMAFNLKRKEYHLLNKYFERFIGEVIGNIHDNPELLEG